MPPDNSNKNRNRQSEQADPRQDKQAGPSNKKHEFMEEHERNPGLV